MLELSNISDEPERSYAIRTTDILDGLRLIAGDDSLVTDDIDASDFVVWHSHPSGAVGPSRLDMRTKLPGLSYMVVTPVGDDLVAVEF